MSPRSAQPWCTFGGQAVYDLSVSGTRCPDCTRRLEVADGQVVRHHPPRPRGGRRAGAGRPRTGAAPKSFSVDARTLDLIRAWAKHHGARNHSEALRQMVAVAAIAPGRALPPDTLRALAGLPPTTS